MNPRIERPIGLLRLVFEVDLGKRHGHAFRIRLAAGSAMRDAGDDDVIQLDDQVLVLALAGLSMGDGRVFDVCPGGARLQEQRRRLVDMVDDGKVLEGRLSRTASTTGVMTPAFVTPHENESTSISSLCLSSSDSPLMSPIFAKMSDAI